MADLKQCCQFSNQKKSPITKFVKNFFFVKLVVFGLSLYCLSFFRTYTFWGIKILSFFTFTNYNNGQMLLNLCPREIKRYPVCLFRSFAISFLQKEEKRWNNISLKMVSYQSQNETEYKDLVKPMSYVENLTF